MRSHHLTPCERRTFRRPFTLPFFDPISCGFLASDSRHRMLARRRSRFMLTPSQPVHVQHDPTGESRDSVFTRRFVGTSRVKTLAVPVHQPIDLNRLRDCRKHVEERWFQKVRGLAQGEGVTSVPTCHRKGWGIDLRIYRQRALSTRGDRKQSSPMPNDVVRYPR